MTTMRRWRKYSSEGDGPPKIHKSAARPPTIAIALVIVIILALAAAVYLTSFGNGTRTTGSSSSTGTQSSTTTSGSTTIQGVVTGTVTVGPSQPVCSTNQSCNEDMTGYSLIFTLQCPGQSDCQTSAAVLSPSGHYSVLLPPGNYTVTGLSPSCNWVGCTSAFPRTVTVQGGMQLVFNVDIDTGIR